jgi:hypothetical protein
MHRVRCLLFGVLMLLALGSFAASSASATSSTSVLLLPGDVFPVLFSSLPSDQPNNGIESELQNAAGTLQGTGFLLQGDITSPTGGLYEVLFLEVFEPPIANRVRCNTAGDGTGEVLVPHAGFHIVHDINSLSGIGILFLVPEFEIKCVMGITVKIRGHALALVEGLTNGVEILQLILAHLHCVTGRVGEPEDTHYWTSLLSSELTARLEANFGTGFRKACEEIKGKIHIDFSKMIEIMNP